ncbi:MAG: VOC family protein [Burkholderiales bacterium]|nr:VOC family protein [Burkholderiales bacterium]
MKFGYTIVYVRDVAASLAFFEKAFGLQRQFLSEGAEFGALATGETTLAFCHHDTARDSVGTEYVVAEESARPLGMEIGLVTDDVAAACTRAVDAGAVLLSPPAAKPWGQTVAYVRAPDGTLVELCTAMA